MKEKWNAPTLEELSVGMTKSGHEPWAYESGIFVEYPSGTHYVHEKYPSKS